MRLCKYCNKPIAQKDIWNPDNDGNGYHHQCLIDMEFEARDKQIYDKGKMDVLEQIRAEIDGIEINGQIDEHTSFIRTGEQVKQMALKIIDKYTKGE